MNSDKKFESEEMIKAGSNRMEQIKVLGNDYLKPLLDDVSLNYAEGYLLDGIMFGDWKEYYTNGDIASGIYLNGEKIGKWESVLIVQNHSYKRINNETFNCVHFLRYYNSKKTHLSFEFEELYKNGKLTGERIVNNYNCDIKRVENYKDGKLESAQ